MLVGAKPVRMKLTSDTARTAERRRALDEYAVANVLANDDFLCSHYNQCKSFHSGIFYEGQLHHVGRFYDLLVDASPLRIIVVGQEYGLGPHHVSSQARYDMIMRSGLECRFKAGAGYKERSPHMRGTTNVLRLLFGLSLTPDHDSEFLIIGGERVHLFDAFSLVNYLLCSAVGNDGSKRGLATRTMMKNCQEHFREVVRILEPTVIVIQGIRFWASIKGAFDSVTQRSDQIHSVRLGLTNAIAAVFTHPSSHPPNNWGTNCKTPYLRGTVAPAIAIIRAQLLGGGA